MDLIVMKSSHVFFFEREPRYEIKLFHSLDQYFWDRHTVSDPKLQLCGCNNSINLYHFNYGTFRVDVLYFGWDSTNTMIALSLRKTMQNEKINI